MHQTHKQAAEKHDAAAQAHRTAAEHNEKGDLSNAAYHAARALQFSDHAYRLARDAHNKSARIERL